MSSPAPLAPDPVTLPRLAAALEAAVARTRPHVDRWVAEAHPARLLDLACQLDPASPLHSLHHCDYRQAEAIVALARIALADSLRRHLGTLAADAGPGRGFLGDRGG